MSATSLNAEIIGWQDRVGSVTAGKFADLVAVAVNPLTNMSALENVGFVMKGGSVYKDELSVRRP